MILEFPIASIVKGQAEFNHDLVELFVARDNRLLLRVVLVVHRLTIHFEELEADLSARIEGRLLRLLSESNLNVCGDAGHHDLLRRRGGQVRVACAKAPIEFVMDRLISKETVCQ